MDGQGQAADRIRIGFAVTSWLGRWLGGSDVESPHIVSKPFGDPASNSSRLVTANGSTARPGTSRPVEDERRRRIEAHQLQPAKPALAQLQPAKPALAVRSTAGQAWYC